MEEKHSAEKRMKKLFIAEKPSVAREFARALQLGTNSRDGYMESGDVIITWCVGHLVTMSYPEIYDTRYKRWSFDTLPFIPKEFKYEVIQNVKKQFTIVSNLLNRTDVGIIYVCTDSGREGEYIYRLVEQMAGVDRSNSFQGKERRRVWIDSQTEEEILRGIREAKDLSAYDGLSDAAYLRAKEDYLMGINFSRALTLKYGQAVKNYLKRDKAVISVGRVMTCVLGMVVNREREIRAFVKTPFFKVLGSFRPQLTNNNQLIDGNLPQSNTIVAEWKAVEGSKYFASPFLYKDNGFLEESEAKVLIQHLEEAPVPVPIVESIERKKEKKAPPLLYNLAELQNDCSRYFKVSPDEALRIVQELYEKKLVTYPRTDARVLSGAAAKEIEKNITGLKNYTPTIECVNHILEQGKYRNIDKTRYVNDKQVTDHYAIIPTGQGMKGLSSLSATATKVYDIIVRRFLSIFLPPAVYLKCSLCICVKNERFFTISKVLLEEGYLKVAAFSPASKRKNNLETSESKTASLEEDGRDGAGSDDDGNNDEGKDLTSLMDLMQSLKKGMPLEVLGYEIKEGETTPPKRYNSGSMILAMENAGQLIEDEELRAQIKGSGIGTSATRAEILKKLVHIEYLALNKKTQILSPTLMGEMVYDVVGSSIRPLLNPALTASWEKGLTMVARGEITSEEYMQKLDDFVTRRTNMVKGMDNQDALHSQFRAVEVNYRKDAGKQKESSI